MKPDEKYMPKTSFRLDGDIEFEQFSNEDILPSSIASLFPVISVDNLSVATMTNSIPYTSQFNTQITLPDLGIQAVSNPNVANVPNPSNVTSLFPDITTADNLYSYNKEKSSTSKNINPTENMNTNMNTNMNKSTTSPSSENRDPVQYLRDINLDIDEEIDLPRCSGNKDIGKIYKKIEDECPGTISLLQAYNIPVPIAKLIIRNIIKTSLHYCKE